jgi:hypothetical protein
MTVIACLLRCGNCPPPLTPNEKELFWIEGTTRRFKDGYNYFGRHPEKVIAFFDQHMK